jgi:hypothetical protein
MLTVHHSEATQSRAKNAGVDLLASDVDLVAQSDYILSIVPPRDAKATAERIITAYSSSKRQEAQGPLHYLDLNAIAPSTARSIALRFEEQALGINLIDGGIIGGPPKATKAADGSTSWYRPSICLSGPHTLASAPKSGADLAELLNTRHVGDKIGVASGLKCCFASLTKGFTALAIQSFSTASALGVLPDLEDYITTYSGAARLSQAQKSLVGMPPKAGRWVEEMREIGRTFTEEGGWDDGEGVFAQIAGVYEFVAEGSVLGLEHVDRRVRGTTSGDVVAALGEGLGERRKRRGSV